MPTPYDRPVSVVAVQRVRPPEDGDEKQTLSILLDFLRATVVNKVAGLTDEQADMRSVRSSELTPAGLVKHLSGVERFWFSIDFAGLDVPWPWTDEDPHGLFQLDEGETLADVVAAYQAECARSRDVTAQAGLDDRAKSDGMNFTLRYALAHMIEETARHCGHLDLIREAIDGQRGE
jgi:uncharacterized damage-inducible protein DinB